MAHSGQAAAFSSNSSFVPHIQLFDQLENAQKSEILASVPSVDVSLQKALRYKNQNIIFKFVDEYAVTEAEALDIFTETKKWLYLCQVANANDFSVNITEPLMVIDKMWHVFLQFTREYQQFCMESFGSFVHHVPFSKADLAKQQATLQRESKTLQQYKKETYEKEIAFTLKHLGRETLVKWYCEYGQKFSLDNLNKLTKLPFDGSASLSKPVNLEDVSKLGTIELSSRIIEQYKTSAYCGGHGCGPYCKSTR